MTQGMREGLALVFEFIVSLVVLVGGGFLVYSGRDHTGVGIMAISSVITFWFARRMQDAKKAATDTTTAASDTTDATSAASAASAAAPVTSATSDQIQQLVNQAVQKLVEPSANTTAGPKA